MSEIGDSRSETRAILLLRCSALAAISPMRRDSSSSIVKALTMAMPWVASCTAPISRELISTDSRLILRTRPRDVDDGPDQRRSDQQRTQRQHRILIDHDADKADQRDRVASDRDQGQRQKVANAADILVDLRRQPARTRVVEEVDAELHQMVEDASLVARHQIVADLGQRHRLAVTGEAAHHEGAHEAGADPDNGIAAPFVEYLVDHRRHDPGA